MGKDIYRSFCKDVAVEKSVKFIYLFIFEMSSALSFISSNKIYLLFLIYLLVVL
jgi:hypothetical protein